MCFVHDNLGSAGQPRRASKQQGGSPLLLSRRPEIVINFTVNIYMSAEKDSGRMLAWIAVDTHDTIFSEMFLELRNAAVFIRNTFHDQCRVFC